jgi:hypothetical protein
MTQNVQTNTDYSEVVGHPATVDNTIDRATVVTHTRGFMRTHISWGAVFAGLALTLVMQIALYLLGISIGALTINPLTEQDPAEGLGTALVIWNVTSTLIALFVGGWVAAYLTGDSSQKSGVVHGLVVWSVSVIASLLLVTTTVGGFVSGTANLLGQAATASASLVESVAPQAAEAAQNAADSAGLSLNDDQIREQVTSAITENTELETVEITDDEAFTQGITEFVIAASRDGIDDNSREALQTTLANSTSLTETEIEQAVVSLENSIDQFTAQVQETTEQVQEQAAVAVENAAEIISAIAGVLFASLIAGAFAAGLGGFVGAPDESTEVEVATTH